MSYLDDARDDGTLPPPNKMLASEIDRINKDNARDAARYRWLRDEGSSRQIVASLSMSIGRGPFIYMTLPACNQFNGMQVTGDFADSAIDAAIASTKEPQP